MASLRRSVTDIRTQKRLRTRGYGMSGTGSKSSRPSHRLSRTLDARTTQYRRRISWFAAVSVVALVAGLSPIITGASADTITNSNDNLLTSWYPNQSALSPQVVQSGNFGQLESSVVDGQVYAQPLVSNGVLVVATENDNVYGLDPVTGAALWSRQLGTPFNPNNYFGAGNSCGDITPNVGITSTPVVDATTGIVYLTTKVLTNPADPHTAQYVMHALSVATGAEQTQLGFPVTLGGVADNDPTHSFTPATELQRPGLLLSGGVVYAAFGSHCDNGPYEGWVLGVSASTGVTKARWTDEAGVPQVPAGPNPAPAGGGFWQAGGGLLTDGTGQIIIASGNGHTPTVPSDGSTPPGSLAQSVIRLTAQPDGTLKATDFFSPYNGASLNQNDSDIGSGPPIELPGSDTLPGSPFGTTTHPHVIVQVGKAGYVFLLDAAHMGGFEQGPSGSDATINTVQANGVWGKPSVWPGDGGWVYMVTAQGGGGSGALRAYKSSLDASGNPTLAYQGRSAQAFGYGSSPAIVTSSGMTSGSALVWTVWEPDASGVGAQLQAYLPVPVNGTLQQVYSAPVGTANKFTEPTADNGKIYIGTRDGHVLIFGTPLNAALAGPAVTFPTTVVGSTSTATATFTANTALTVASLAALGGRFTAGTSTPALPATLNPGDILSVPVTFTPGTAGLAGGSLVAATTVGATASIALSGQGETAGPHLAVYPCCVSFGGVAVGNAVSNTVTLTNDGASTLTVNGVNLPTPPYAVSGMPVAGSTIASGASVTATVTFTPATVGEYTNELTVATDGGNTSISLDGTGGTAPQMQISQSSLQYGQVPQGVTATQTFTVRNVGGTALTITKSKAPQGDGGFVTDTPSLAALAEGTVIQPGQTVQARVNFTPATAGLSSTTWTLNANDSGGVRQVSFTGTGTTVPNPTVIVGNVDVTIPSSGTTPANFPVFLAPGAVSSLATTFTTHDGSAKASSGAYVAVNAAPGTVTPGQTMTFPITVNPAAGNGQKFYLDANVPAGQGTTVNGIAWLSTTPVVHPFILVEPVNAWRSPSENTTINVPIVLESAVTTSTKITVKSTDGTAVSGVDYAGGINKSITVPAGQTTYQLPVQILKGAQGSTAPLTFTLTLSGAQGLTKVASPTATVTIYPPSSDVSLPPPPQPLAWTQDTPSTNATVGATYAYSFAASGDPAPTFAIGAGGLLPSGVDLDTTGILAGTPTQAGDFTFAVVASNGVSAPITSPTVTLHVAALPVGPSFVSDNPPTSVDLGAHFSYTFVAQGQPAPTYSVSSGALPPGMSLNTVTGVLSGLATTIGTYSFVVSADNGIDVAANSPLLTMTVGTGLAFTSTPTASGYVGQPFSYTLTTSGSPAASLSLSSGALPTGLTLTSNGDGTGTLAGTVDPSTAVGSVALVFKAINGVNSPVTQNFTLNIAAAADLATTMTGPKAVSVGTQVTYTVTVTNNGPSSVTTPVTVTFGLPANTSFVSALSGGTYASGVVTWPMANLSKLSHINLKVTIQDNQTGTDTATGNATSGVFDPTSANNSAVWTNSVR